MSSPRQFRVPLRGAGGSAYPKLAAGLAEASRTFYGRGWALGTSGNFSAILSRNPLRLIITPSGVDKGTLTAEQLVVIDENAKVVRGKALPSTEALLHLTLARVRGAGAVLHTHSVWGTVLSERFASKGGVSLAGYEMLKGLNGVNTHEHREWLPIIENSQDIAALARRVEATLLYHPDSHGFLLSAHGLYTWGRDLTEARRHLEILEFLLEALGRTYSTSAQFSDAASTWERVAGLERVRERKYDGYC